MTWMRKRRWAAPGGEGLVLSAVVAGRHPAVVRRDRDCGGGRPSALVRSACPFRLEGTAVLNYVSYVLDDDRVQR